MLLRIPNQSVSSEFQTIGTKLYVLMNTGSEDESWQQWDLLTGAPGPTCNMHLRVDYVASDGTVVISKGGVGGNVAVDTSTCQTLWSTPAEPEDSRVVIWKVGTGLIQRTRVSDSIVSLRAPA